MHPTWTRNLDKNLDLSQNFIIKDKSVRLRSSECLAGNETKTETTLHLI